MSTAALAAKQVDAKLRAFQNARGNARRFHADVIGDEDPNYSFADWLLLNKQKDSATLEKRYGSVRTKAALIQTGGTTGGYLVPESMQYDLMQDVAEDSIIRPRALVMPMTTASLKLPLPTPGTGTAGVSFAFGGFQLYWTGDSLTRTESEPTFREVELKPWELSGYLLASNPLLQDGGTPLSVWLRRLFARSIAWYEDLAFITGNGQGRPVGITTGPGVKTVTRAGGNHVTAADLAKMTGALIPGSWDRAIWLINPSALADIEAIASWQLNQPQPQSQNNDVGILNGRPAFITEKVPVLGTQGDVSLVNAGLYCVGDRNATEIAFADQEKSAFLLNQSVIRIVHRVDGQPNLATTVVLADGSTTASAYVVLAG